MEPRSLRPHSSSFASLPLLLLLCSVFALSVAQHTPRCGDDDRETPAPNDNGEYDFIVVGGGTGGAIVASRLSKYFNVLLLEAGDRLYDSAELSFKYLSPVLLGSLDPSNGLSSVLDPILKGIGKITPEGFFLDSEGHLHGSVGEGVPGFMPHIQETPFMAFYMTMSEAAHYYPTVPQIYSQKREIDYPRGNCLGGSSAANTMVYFRGSKRDFEQWKDEFGLEGWGYEDVLPYFKKYENNVDIQDDRVHGHHGPINITIVKNHFPSPATDAWTETALKLGYPKITDASNPETTYGASDSWQQFVGPNGKRSDTSDYIRILDSKGKVCWNKPKEECEPSQKLHIWTKKYVTKLLIDTSSTEAGGRPRAYGVEYVDDASSKEADRTYHPRWRMRDNEGKKHHKPFNKWDKDDVQSKIPTYGAPVDRDLAFDYDRTREQYIPYYDEEMERQIERKRVTARHEVILSSGAVVTGQLLMLSGIGPANHLKERGISVIADLPVGQRMQDHQEVMSLWKFPDAMTPGFNFLSEAAKGFPTLRAHIKGERTFFSSNGVPAGLEGSSAGPHGTVPKWHMHHITMGAFENFDYNLAAYDETVNPPYRIPRSPLELFRWKGLTLHAHNCELSQNHAYGRLELRSKDPFQPPLLDPRYGSSEEDNLEMVDCLETVREIMNNTDPLYAGEELGASAKAKTREQLLQFVRNAVWGHHISGSAPMGSCSVPFAVTDPRARVKKVDGLRVCDISLVPTIPHGNPAGVVMMMAEKIADLIKQDHKDYFDWSSLSSPTGTDSDPLYHDEL